MSNSIDYYIKEFTIPFYQSEVINWDVKKSNLLKIYDQCSMGHGDQNTDYSIKEKNPYSTVVNTIFYEDLKKIQNCLEYPNPLKVDCAWFQSYNESDHHSLHNHGYGYLSMVCYINYDSNYHKPTTFVAPFYDFMTGNTMQYEPQNIKEGSIIVFPSSLPHFVPPNRSKVERLILSANIC